jgi:hypothetical protein
MKAAIDRIEEGIAILIPLDDDTERIRLPVSSLPPGCREGDIITLPDDRDEAATTGAKDRVSNLIRKLQDRNR